MTCPNCRAITEAPQMVGTLTICPICLASVVIVGGVARRAVAEDTVPLSEGVRKALIGLRSKMRKANAAATS